MIPSLLYKQLLAFLQAKPRTGTGYTLYQLNVSVSEFSPKQLLILLKHIRPMARILSSPLEKKVFWTQSVLMFGPRKKKWTKWDSGWQNNMISESVVPTKTRLHHNISDQGVSLDGVDSVFTSVMLGAHILSELRDADSKDALHVDVYFVHQ